MNVKPYFLAILALSLLWLVFGDRPQQHTPVEMAIKQQQHVEAAEVEWSVERSNQAVKARFVDKISGEHIDQSRVQWYSSEANLTSNPYRLLSDIDASVIKNLQGVWTFEAHGVVRHTGLSDSHVDGNLFELPISSSLNVKVNRAYDLEARSELALLYAQLDHVLWSEARAAIPGDELFAMQPHDSINSILGRYKKLSPDEVTFVAIEDTGNVVFEDGTFGILKAYAEEYGDKTQTFLIRSGAHTDVVIDMIRRPRVEGYFYDVDGKPVANALVIVSAVLDARQPDYSSSDQLSGLTAARYGEPGKWTQLVKKYARTNAQGFYSVSMPKANQYATNSQQESGYAFAESVFFRVPPLAPVRIDIQPDNSSGYKITVEFPDGSPAAGKYIHLIIADDFPFMRVLPGYLLDENGECEVPMLVGGRDKISLWLCDTFDRWDDQANRLIIYGVKKIPVTQPFRVIAREGG